MKPLKNPFGIQDPLPQTTNDVDSGWSNDVTGVISLNDNEDSKLIEEKRGSPNQTQEINLDEELPLLEELDITSPLLIKKRILDVILFRKNDEDYFKDPDLSGPILLMLTLGISLMLSGKIHFNYLYGFGLVGWLSIYALMNFMNQDKLIEFYQVLSYLGYGLSPIVILSIVNVFIQFNSIVGYTIAAVIAVWSTMSVSNTFDQLLALDHRRLLIAYPLFLFYCTFVLITIF